MRALVASLVVSSTLAYADPAAPTDIAAQLFEQGRTLAKAGQWVEACRRFTRSLELDHALGTELNLADCQEHLGNFAEAWHLFAEASVHAERASDSRAAFAHERAEALTGKLATVVVALADPEVEGLTVTIGGRRQHASAEIHDRVEPGTVEVVVDAPGYAPIERSERAVAGETVRIEIPAFAEHVTTATAARRRSRVIAAVVVEAGGAVALGTGLVFGLVARHDYGEQLANGSCVLKGSTPSCDPAGYTNVNTAGMLADVGTGFGVVGLALVAAGAVLYFTAPRELVVAPVASREAAGISLSGRF